MALGALPKKYINRSPAFYRDHYHHILMGLMLLMVLMMTVGGVLLYQMYNRPLPQFHAVQVGGKKMQLTAFNEPNLSPDTILRWASKAATLAYTFDFVNYNQQVAAVRPYFTPNGWADYLASVDPLINTIVQAQLFINGVVAGQPVISNQGPLPGQDYVWRVQIPFLVTYQSANALRTQNFYVVISIVRVPTHVNPQGIGIDQFVMVNR